MISFFIKHKKSILIITLAFFIGSIIYIGADAYHRGGFNSNVATVGSEAITYRQLSRITENQARLIRNQGVDVDENTLKFLEQQTLSQLISAEIMVQSAKEMGLDVADYEIAYEIQNSPFFAPQGAFNKENYLYALKQNGTSPAEFEDALRREKLLERFRSFLFSRYKLTPEEIKSAYKVQHGNMKNFEKNKKEFALQLLETKMETAQSAFFDKFNNEVEIKTFLQD